MRLVSLRIEAKGLQGWESPLLQFGHRVTSVFAPNGSGKTPIVQSIGFCLGYPTIFRDDINSHCAAAALTVDIDGRTVVFRRVIQKDFYLVTTNQEGGRREFFSEGDFTKALFEDFNVRLPWLVSTSKEATHPFMSTLLPLFYLVQDGGYSQAYHTSRPFITDQFVEMVRFLFRLAPKHSFQAKKDLLGAKESLEAINRRILKLQSVVSDLASRTDDTPETVQRLADQSEQLQHRLTELRQSMSVESTVRSALADALAGKDSELRSARNFADGLRQRIAGIEGIRAEIDAEIETLSLNEESKRIFESLDEICGNKDCGLFIGSSEAYAKNLLYLKDQIKDLERNAEANRVRLADLESDLRDLERDRAGVFDVLSSSNDTASSDQLVAAIQQITVSVFDLEQRRGAIRILSDERAKLLRLESDREKIQDTIANLSNVGRADIAFNQLRREVKDSIIRWLDILGTLNVSRDIEIDLDFRFRFGGEPIEAITGSTRIRVVLAIHAALMQLYWRDADAPMRFMVLDTPKQQEMQTGDLAEFLVALSELCGNNNAQLVFSSTEYHFPLAKGDLEWLPSYRGNRQPMYLGPPISPDSAST